MVRKLLDNVLRDTAQPIIEITDEIRELLNDMLETMEINNGVGLAAPQIGISLQLIVIRVDGITYKLVNPIILKEKGLQSSDEGCLSLPGKVGKVWRPEKVVITALDENGAKIKFTAHKNLARVISHEVDHLNGILFTDKLREF